MSIKSDIFDKFDVHYTAKYGWQSNFNDEAFTFGYIDSYKSTADLLVDQCAADLYIFPIIFSYRQYLELVLKNVCYKNMNSKEYIKFIESSSHNLIKIWKNAEIFLKKDVQTNHLNEIEEVIKLFDELDSTSFTFRYEFDKKLNRSIKEESLEINTLELKKWIYIVDSYLCFTYDSI